MQAQADAQLVAAVRDQYPDLSKAPDSIRAAVEKAEAMSTNQIATALHKCTHQVRQTSNKLKELKESQVRHKEAWHVHLKEAITSWEGQVQAYTSQQTVYKDLMETARTEFQAARKEIQRLNQLAAGSTGRVLPSSVDLTEPEEIVIDETDSVALMENVQAVLKNCAKIFLNADKKEPRAVSVPSDDEQMGPPAGKRQRSADSVGFGVPGGVPTS